MGLPTRDLTVLLVVAVIALVSFHWEAAFEFRTLEPLSIQTTSANAEFKNVYASLLILLVTVSNSQLRFVMSIN
jgi:hypothetical protein